MPSLELAPAAPSREAFARDYLCSRKPVGDECMSSPTEVPPLLLIAAAVAAAAAGKGAGASAEHLPEPSYGLPSLLTGAIPRVS